MRKFVLSILMVGMLACTANAMTVGMEFQGDGGYYSAEPSELVWIDVIVNLAPSDTLSGVGFAPIVPFPVTVESSEPGPGFTDGSSLPGWINFGIQGGFMHNDTTENMDVLVGSFDVHIGEGGEFSDEYEIYFDHATVFITDQFGNELTWHAGYAPTYSGYIAYHNWGNPGWTAKGVPDQPTPNPLILHDGTIPEPGSLALLALGGLALLRRR